MPLIAVAAAAFAVEIPFFWLGTPSGHDVEFHLYSWLEVLAHWRQGVLYPRWAGLAHFGFGEPRFIFYPPASWLLGSLISKVLPWTVASCVFIWIVLMLAGSSMFLLARRWLSRRDAIFAAVLYAVNPYHLVIVYWRSAFAELLASCLVPLLVLVLIKARGDERRALIPLGVILGASWLVNAPAALMIHYSMALLVMLLAWQRKSTKLLFVAAGAVLLGACMSAFYLLPAVYEQRWIDIGNAVSAGSRPTDNFLFIHTTDAEHDAFNKLISWVAVLEMLIVAGCLWLCGAWRKANRELWNGLTGWAVACTLMMFSITALLWNILPKLAFMQFPWRWMLCLSMMFSLLVALAVQDWWRRAAIYLLSLMVIVVAWHRVQAPWWDTTADLREMQDNIATGAGYEGTDEYTPLGAEPTNVDKEARRVTVHGSAHATIRVMRWDEESREFTAEMSAADQLAVKLFRYPAWRVSVNGQKVETLAREGTGQMLVPVAAGMNRVTITFVRTWDRTVGEWVSLIVALGLLFYEAIRRRQTA